MKYHNTWSLRHSEPESFRRWGFGGTMPLKWASKGPPPSVPQHREQHRELLTPLWTWSILLSEWLCVLSLHIQQVWLWGRLLGALEKAECLGVVKRFSLDQGNQFWMTLMGVRLLCSPMTKRLPSTLYLLCLSLIMSVLHILLVAPWMCFFSTFLAF